MRFEANGDSRKEVHTIVKIINILGAKEFARISFDYDRAFQQVEIPMVRVNHANGGTSEVLPSAVTDTPNAAVEQFPVYQDVRVKSVRILGLQEGDTVEYRVITTTTNHPLAPDFWLEHTFDRSGQVLRGALRTRSAHFAESGAANQSRCAAYVERKYGSRRNGVYDLPLEAHVFPAKGWRGERGSFPDAATRPDVAVSTFTWERLSSRLGEYATSRARAAAGNKYS